MRNGKIARLPRHIREELNRRLDNGEPGVRLVEWLNTLPEVKEVLKTYFEKHLVNEVNLTEWKQGGFLDWQAHRQRLGDMKDLEADGQELVGLAPGVADNIEATLITRYATILKESKGQMTEELRAELQCLGKSVRDLVRYRRFEQARVRTQIQRQRLELQQAKFENQKNHSYGDPSSRRSGPESNEITEEEKARRLKEHLFPRDLFPEKYQDEQSQENQPPSQPI